MNKNKKNIKKQMLGDDVAQGPWKSRRIKNVDGYLFSTAMLMLRGRPTYHEGLSLIKLQ